MLMYDNKRGMHYCLFHAEEHCWECTAKRCIHARGDEDGFNPRSKEDARYIKVVTMNKCIFLDGDWTCDDCDVRKVGMCFEAFYKKYGYFKEEG